jgi:hypothetical protein
MRASLLLAMGLFGWLSGIQAQSPVRLLQGTVIDSLDNRPLDRAVVSFVEWGRTDTLRLLTDAEGHFRMNRASSSDFLIAAAFVGYQRKTIRYPGASKEDLGRIALSPKIREMQEVMIEAPLVSLKADTVEYRADGYPVRKDAVLEDILKKLPGLRVDKDGHITAYGQAVVKIRVNGKDFFLGDPRLASQNLPADVIEKIQVIEDKSDQAKFSGFDDGERTQIINITIKKSRTDAYFGNVSAGIGTDDRYLALARVFRFDPDQQVALIGHSNNTNGADLTSGNTAGGPGINQSHMIGLDLTKTLGPRLTLTGGYYFQVNNTTSFQQSIRTYYVDTSYTYEQEMETIARQQSHNLQIGLGYRAGKMDSLRFVSQLSYILRHQQTYSDFSFLDSLAKVTNTGQQNYAVDNTSPNLSGAVTWMHRFDKTGRALTTSASAGPGPARETDNNFSTNHIYYPSSIDTIWQVSDMRTHHQNYSFRADYTEPLEHGRALEIDYSYSRSGNLSGKNVYDMNGLSKILNDSLTNSFKNVMTTNRLSLKFMEEGKKYNYQVGLGVQPTELYSRSVTTDTPRVFVQREWQVVPSASMFYQLTTAQRIRFNYIGYSKQPSINQLQPVPDYTNPLYTAMGNPDLKPSFIHDFRIGYNDIDRLSGRTFFLEGFATITQNAIVDDITFAPGGKQVVQPVNVNGNYVASGSCDYAIPFDRNRFTLSFSGTVDYAHNVNLYGGARTIGQSWKERQNIRLIYDIDKWFDLTTTVEYTNNHTTYSPDTMQANTFSTWNFSQEGRVDFRKDFSFRYTFNYLVNQGLAGGIGKNVALMSAVLEKRVYRDKGIVALSVNDLFNDNTNFSHTALDGYVEDDRAAVLNRFFLVSFTWKFQQRSDGQPR